MVVQSAPPSNGQYRVQNRQYPNGDNRGGSLSANPIRLFAVQRISPAVRPSVVGDEENTMPNRWNSDGTFHLGINMAGAISAGAYTTGGLDFLTEALEEWYAAKGSPNPSVPMHDISVDVFSGASAGGMCAAIASVMLQGSFQ